MNDLIQLCIKVEQQNLRKTSSRREGSYSNSYPKREYKREETIEEKPKETPQNIDKEVITPQPRSRDKKCFKCFGRGHIVAQCPNRRTIFLRGKDVYSSQSDEASGEEEKENSEGAYPCEGELMMIRRTLNNQPSMNQETQRENIFHIRCKVFENECSLIVDSGSLPMRLLSLIKKKKFILYPLPPSQVVKDQEQMRKKRGRKINKNRNPRKRY